MRTLTSTQLENTEVINLCDGARLGCPEALELQTDGCGLLTVTALLIPLGGGLADFLRIGSRDVLRIPVCRIECIGQDTILVKLTEAELASCRVRVNGKGRIP